VVSDIGLRLSEGIQELKLDQQLAPAREAVSSAISAGSAGFFKAVEGVRGRWAQRQSSQSAATGPSPQPSSTTTRSSTPVEVTRSEAELPIVSVPEQPVAPPESKPRAGGIRPLSLIADKAPPIPEPKPAAAGWGISSFLSSRWSAPRATSPQPAPALTAPTPSRKDSLPPPAKQDDPELGEWQPRNLDEEGPRK
jgi:hypothetical protein